MPSLAGPFLAKLFAALSRQSWNGVSLLYLSYALLGFHKVPVVDDEMLKDVGWVFFLDVLFAA